MPAVVVSHLGCPSRRTTPTVRTGASISAEGITRRVGNPDLTINADSLVVPVRTGPGTKVGIASCPGKPAFSPPVMPYQVTKPAPTAMRSESEWDARNRRVIGLLGYERREVDSGRVPPLDNSVDLRQKLLLKRPGACSGNGAVLGRREDPM